MSARTRQEVVLAISQKEIREIPEEERETEAFMTFEQAPEWGSGRTAPRLRFARLIGDGELKRSLAAAAGYSLREWFDELAEGNLHALGSKRLRRVWRERVKSDARLEIDVMLEVLGRPEEEVRSGRPRRFRALARADRRPQARDS